MVPNFELRDFSFSTASASRSFFSASSLTFFSRSSVASSLAYCIPRELACYRKVISHEPARSVHLLLGPDLLLVDVDLAPLLVDVVSCCRSCQSKKEDFSPRALPARFPSMKKLTNSRGLKHRDHLVHSFHRGVSAALTLADRLWVPPPRLDKAENVEHDFFLALGLELFGLTGRKI